MLNSNNNIIFFEVFEEEKNAISKFLPNDINATFHQNTIQETCKSKDIKLEKNTVISIRTQSIIPEKWSSKISAILTLLKLPSKTLVQFLTCLGFLS